jgi:hypothetical protein
VLQSEIPIKNTILAILLSVGLTIPVLFLTRSNLETPLISLILGQVAIVFLVVLAAFPKHRLVEICGICSKYLCFIAFCFAIIAFIPFPDSNKLLAFTKFYGIVPMMINTNIIAVLMLNLIAALFYIRFTKRNTELQNETANHIENQYQTGANFEAQFDNKPKHNPTNQQQTMTAKKEPETEMQALFNIYLDEKNISDNQDEKLDNIENAVLENLCEDITGAQCLNRNGQTLEDSVLNWQGYDKQNLIAIFNKNNLASVQLGMKALCQFLFNDDKYWYIVAKYRGNFILLQTDLADPGILMETIYKVISSLKDLESQVEG